MGCVCSHWNATNNRVHPLTASPAWPKAATSAHDPDPGPRRRRVPRLFLRQRSTADEVVCQGTPKSPEELWALIEQRCPLVKKQPQRRRERAWKTIHIYVSSTFPDFHTERGILVSQVFPEIARWCKNIRMQLVPIDLKWGLSKEMQTTDFLLASMREIERCSEDNMPLFFLALLSETLGWVPSREQLPQSVAERYHLVPGMSLLEMETVCGAYRTGNPNAVFLFRDPSFLSHVPHESYRNYVDPETSRNRVQMLKSRLRAKFPEQIFTYQCSVSAGSGTQHGGDATLEPRPTFRKLVTQFFINRIRKEFHHEVGPMSLLSLQSEQQREELERLCSAEMLGKSNVVEKIVSYVESPGSCSPLLLVGELGSGKSTVVAKCAQLYITKQLEAKLQQAAKEPPSGNNVKDVPKESSRDKHRAVSAPPPQTHSAQIRSRRRGLKTHMDFVPLQQDDTTSSTESVHDSCEDLQPLGDPKETAWHVFYHFVCAIPRSVELRHILQRIWAIEQLGEPKTSPMKTELNGLAKDVLQVLSTRGRKKYLLLIDGIDRIKDEYHSSILKWIPGQLPENIRIVVTLSPNGETRKVFNSRDPKCIEVHCGMLSLALSRQLISRCLMSHGLTGTPQLYDILLGKLGVCNPHYVVEVCRELARSSESGDIIDNEVAERIPGDLPGLYDYIIGRLEDEAGGRLVIAALCLLECSRCGLQEPELLDMLGALSPSGYSSEHTVALSRRQGKVSDTSVPESTRQWASSAARTCTSSSRLQSVEKTFTYHHPDLEAHNLAGPDLLGVLHSHSVAGRAESSLYAEIPRTSHSRPQLRSHERVTSCGSLTEFEDSVDNDSALQLGVRSSSQMHDGCKTSPAHSLILPGALRASSDEWKLSPKSAKRHQFVWQSASFSSAHEVTANPSLAIAVPISPECCPASTARPHKLPPSPTLSLLSAELAHAMRKSNSPSQLSQSDVQAEAEIQEVAPSGSSGQHSLNQTPLRKRVTVGLDRMNIIHMTSAVAASRLPSFLWAHLLHHLGPFLKHVGRPSESRWAIATKAFSRAVRKKYFKQPPTQTFPFSFCTTPAFYGADKDQNLYSILSQKRRHSVSSPFGPKVSPGTTVQGDVLRKRFDWWHARLAGYFSVSTNEDRRAEELPFHLARIQDYGRLSHSLVHFPVFERLSDSENLMDLLRFWRCAGGYSNAVSMYQHALEELEISGASAQEMVHRMHEVALFLHKAGETEAAQHILVDAIELEETRVGGRVESMARLTLSMTEILSLSSRQQAQYLEPRQIMEPEYRLLKFAGRSVEFHRGLQGADAEQDLALLLMLLSIHLLHYANLGGSAALSRRSALVEARETAQEAAELYARQEDYGHLLEAYVHLASTYDDTPRRKLEILRDARKICREHFGELNSMMLRILSSTAECRSWYNSAELCYKKWAELTAVMYGDHHPYTAIARERVADFLASHGKKEEALAFREASVKRE